jgi:hypothetical protein
LKIEDLSLFCIDFIRVDRNWKFSFDVLNRERLLHAQLLNGIVHEFAISDPPHYWVSKSLHHVCTNQLLDGSIVLGPSLDVWMTKEDMPFEILESWELPLANVAWIVVILFDLDMISIFASASAQVPCELPLLLKSSIATVTFEHPLPIYLGVCGIEHHDLLSKVRAWVVLIKRSVGSIDPFNIFDHLFLLELGHLSSPFVLRLSGAHKAALGQNASASLLQRSLFLRWSSPFRLPHILGLSWYYTGHFFLNIKGFDASISVFQFLECDLLIS